MEGKSFSFRGGGRGANPAGRGSGGIRRATLSALKAGGFEAEVKAPFYGSLLNAYARGEIGLLESLAGLEGVDEESLVGGPGAILETYVDISQELTAEPIEEIRLPIPNFVREWAMHSFMADVSTYLAMKRAKEAIWGVITSAWNEFGPSGPDLVVAHSLGSVIAYDTCADFSANIRVRLLVTAGAPLGYPIVRRNLRGGPEGVDERPVPAVLDPRDLALRHLRAFRQGRLRRTHE